MKLWCFDDAHRWGQSLHDAATKRGHDSSIFDAVHEPTQDGVLFFHMHNHPAVRKQHKRLVAHFATKPGLRLVPSYRMSVLFDDRYEQLRQLARWMPKTEAYQSPHAARAFIESNPEFPIISRSAQGSITNNVRLVQTADDARKEVRLAFSDLGIRMVYEQKQHGYLLWQEFVPSDPHYRVIAIGDDRIVGKGVYQESGSIALSQADMESEEAQEVLAFADRFFNEERINYGSLVICKGQSGWVLQDMTLTWHRSFYEQKDVRFVKSGKPGTAMWEVMLDQLEAGTL